MAGRMSYFAVVWNLIPFIRADGYWALCDALGFRDLDRPCEVVPSRPKLIFLLIHRVLNIVFLIFVAVVLPVVWAFGCSGWKDGCGYILEPKVNEDALSEQQIHLLLQQRILPRPMRIKDEDKIVILSTQGVPMDLRLPSAERQKKGGKD